MPALRAFLRSRRVIERECIGRARVAIDDAAALARPHPRSAAHRTGYRECDGDRSPDQCCARRQELPRAPSTALHSRCGHLWRSVLPSGLAVDPNATTESLHADRTRSRRRIRVQSRRADLRLVRRQPITAADRRERGASSGSERRIGDSRAKSARHDRPVLRERRDDCPPRIDWTGARGSRTLANQCRDPETPSTHSDERSHRASRRPRGGTRSRSGSTGRPPPGSTRRAAPRRRSGERRDNDDRRIDADRRTGAGRTGSRFLGSGGKRERAWRHRRRGNPGEG